MEFQEIISFWYGDSVKPLWFNSTTEFDQTLKERFETTYLAARNGKLDDWKDSGLGLLALVILYDQIPLNIYRGNAKGFETEALARDMAEIAIKNGWDKTLSREQQAFLYMPFMHSENLDDQDRGIAFFEAAGLTENAKFAHHHRAIIERFGRFPHRNTILGRESSEAELAYLNSGEAFLG